jgi:hypothetical protein
MATSSNGATTASATKVLIRVVLYYALLVAIGFALWRYLPRTRLIASDSLNALFSAASEPISGSGKSARVAAVAPGTLAETVALAMLAAALLTLPVAWIYTLTRSRRGYQQSVVQLLVMLPVVVAGVVVLVKYSLALAFSLGGIAAAVRFRNSLDDSKDAVYVFLVIGIGIATAVDLPVAVVLSIMFNIVIVALWMTDFGRTPVALDGRLAERRLARARQLARTGTFVARIDDEVLRDMTSEQLEGVAQRAWRRAREHNPEGGEGSRPDSKLRFTTRDVNALRATVEPKLEEYAKRWRLTSVTPTSDGITLVEYDIAPKKSKGLDEVLSAVREVAAAQLLTVELQ